MKLNIEMLATIFLLVGGINWGLVGAFDYNLVTTLLGDGTVTRVVYGLVGLGAVYHLLQHFKGSDSAPAEEAS